MTNDLQIGTKQRSAMIVGLSLLFFSLLLLAGCGVTEYQKRWFDADQDGVADAYDKCLETLHEVVVNRHGCNLFHGVLEDVTFDTNVAALSPAARRSLDELVRGMKQHPDTVIGVHAHTDNRGKAVKNLELSKRRVMQVVEYLVVAGVEPHRLKPYGYGESRPRKANATEQGRMANRRIELVLLERKANG